MTSGRVTNITLGQSDAASSVLPSARLVSGTFFQPLANPLDLDLFPAPAPPGPYGSALSAFAGQEPNGA